MAQLTDRDAEFSAFLAADSVSLARAARQVTGGDTEAAAELLQTALVKTYVAWPRVGPDGALAHVRGLLGATGVDEADVPGVDPADVTLDAEHVLSEGRNAVRGRRMGWTVAGLAALAVIASIVTPVLIASSIPPVPTTPPVTTPSAAPSSSATSTASALSLLGTPWQVAGFDDLAFGPTRTMTLQFDGGVLSGFSGCNSFRGSYSLDGDRLTVDDVAVGAMGCPGRAGREEAAFLAALRHVRGYEQGLNGPVLVGADGSPVVALIPLTPDAATWQLVNLAGTDQVAAGITLTVAGDQLRGESGCGEYTADLTRAGNAWTVSNLALSTTVRCPEAANRRATRYLTALGQVTEAELDPFRLTLTGPGARLSFAPAAG